MAGGVNRAWASRCVHASQLLHPPTGSPSLPPPPPTPADPRQQRKKAKKQSKQQLLETAQEKQTAAADLGATEEGKVRWGWSGGGGGWWGRCARAARGVLQRVIGSEALELLAAVWCFQPPSHAIPWSLPRSGLQAQLQKGGNAHGTAHCKWPPSASPLHQSTLCVPACFRRAGPAAEGGMGRGAAARQG